MGTERSSAGGLSSEPPPRAPMPGAWQAQLSTQLQPGRPAGPAGGDGMGSEGRAEHAVLFASGEHPLPIPGALASQQTSDVSLAGAED